MSTFSIKEMHNTASQLYGNAKEQLAGFFNKTYNVIKEDPEVIAKKILSTAILSAGAGLAGTYIFNIAATAHVAAAIFAIMVIFIGAKIYTGEIKDDKNPENKFFQHISNAAETQFYLGLASTLYFKWAGLQFACLIGVPYSLLNFTIIKLESFQKASESH